MDTTDYQLKAYNVTQLFKRASVALVWLCALAVSVTATAQSTVCAEVKIEIAQELTIERQAFERKWGQVLHLASNLNIVQQSISSVD